MKEYPLFSVLIPQKNRAEYIGYTLRTCMIQDYPNFEIIVSDDCSTDDSITIIEDLAKQDSRIKLFAHKTHLGMRDNFEFALNQVKSGYVIVLGGDDGLVKDCIWKMYEILTKTGKELLTWPLAVFTYPDKLGDENILAIKRKRDCGVKILKSSDFLNKIAKTFQYQIDECPMLYMKGVASVDLINRVKSRSSDGCFYHCPTPDGFSGVVLAGEVDDYAYTNEPLSIGGDTIKSQGKNYRRNDKSSQKEAKEFFNDNIRRTMHPELASQQYSPLITLMTADYLLTARDLPGWPGYFEMFSFKDLLLKTFRFIQESSYSTDVIGRELNILKEIAKKHNLLDLFETLYEKTKIRYYKPTDIKGFLITNSIRFEGKALGINNVYDASLVVPFIYKFYTGISKKEVVKMLKNSLKIIRNSRSYTEKTLPKI